MDVKEVVKTASSAVYAVLHGEPPVPRPAIGMGLLQNVTGSVFLAR